MPDTLRLAVSEINMRNITRAFGKNTSEHYKLAAAFTVIFAACLFPELLAASPEVGARQVVWAHPDEVLEMETNEEGVELNLNDPESLKRANEASRSMRFPVFVQPVLTCIGSRCWVSADR